MRQLDVVSLLLDAFGRFLDAIGNIPFGSVLLKVTLVLGLATAACALLQRQSAAFRHRIWVLALGVTLALPLALLMPQFELRVLPGAVDSPRQGLTVAPEVAQAKVSIAPAEKTRPESKAEFSRQESALQVGMKTESTRAESATESRQDASIETSPARSAKSLGMGKLLVFTWLLGTTIASLLFVVSMAIQTIQLSRLRHVIDDEWADSMNEAARRLGLQRPIVTLESDQACVPAVVGILSPRLVVPHDWRTWSLAQRNCILLHELAHVKRFDVLTQFMGRLAVLAYWFHPLVWFAVRQLRAERELASDDCVLLAGPAASDYAEELLRTLRCYRPVRPALGVAMAHSARLDRRVLAILDALRCRSPLNRATATVLLGLVGILGGVFGGVTLAARLVDEPVGAKRTQDDENKPGEKRDEKPDDKKPLTAKELTGKWFGEAENQDGIRKLVAHIDFDRVFGGDVHWRLRYETEESGGAEIGHTGHRVENAATGHVDLYFKKTALGHLARGEGDTILLTILPEFEKKNMPGERVYRRFEGLVLRRMEEPNERVGDLKALQGTWTVLEERRPDPLEKDRAEQIKGGDLQWRFSGSKFAPALKGNQQEGWTDIYLDSSRSPKEMHTLEEFSLFDRTRAVRSKVIYELKGDDLRVFGWVPRQGAAPAVPRDFDPKNYPGEKWTLTTLKRTTGEDKKDSGQPKQGGKEGTPVPDAEGRIEEPAQPDAVKKLLDTMEGYRNVIPPPKDGLEEHNGPSVPETEPYILTHLDGVARRLNVTTKAECEVLLPYLKDEDPRDHDAWVEFVSLYDCTSGERLSLWLRRWLEFAAARPRGRAVA